MRRRCSRLAADGATLIVTVDCGAQAFDPLAAVAEAGIEVIVVDHHQCAAALPRALAVVNPNRLDEGETGAAHGHLAAAGMAFLLGAAVLRELRARGWLADRIEPRLLDLLDLVALGTVADVARLTGLNRAFVAQGLKVMAQGRNPGLVALARAAGIARAPTCLDLGFALGPRINAGGRVGRADLGVRLLATDDEAEAEAIAAELDALNGARRAIEAAVLTEAQAQAAGQAARAVVVVAGRGWHPGVIGIVSGRLKEALGRPVLVIRARRGRRWQGPLAGRSRGSISARPCSPRGESGLLLAGGGHAMAAGLTVAADGVPALADFLEARLAAGVARARSDRALLVDAVLGVGGVGAELVDALEAGGPYGAGWPAPRVVAGPVRVIRADMVGNGHVRAVVAGECGRSLKVMAFRHAEGPLGQALLGAPPHRRLWLAGRARRDDWTGGAACELHLDDAAWADGSAAD